MQVSTSLDSGGGNARAGTARNRTKHAYNEDTQSTEGLAKSIRLTADNDRAGCPTRGFERLVAPSLSSSRANPLLLSHHAGAP